MTLLLKLLIKPINFIIDFYLFQLIKIAKKLKLKSK